MRQMLENPHLRYCLMALGMLSLMAGLGAGLLRLAWPLASPRPILAMMHGLLMVCGFLGTLISLDCAVALERICACTAPILTGLSGTFCSRARDPGKAFS